VLFEQTRLNAAQQLVHHQQRFEFVSPKPEAGQFVVPTVAVVEVSPAGHVLDGRAEMVPQMADGAEEGGA